jgi:hypothetical protein
MMVLGIYGIWSKEEKRVIYISLDQEEVELEYDMEGYPEETHAIVFMNAAYDISSLGLLSQ